MQKKMYILSFNTPADPKALHASLDGNSKISDWMHYIENTYLLVSGSSKGDLYKDLLEAIGNKRFIFMEVDPKTNHRGRLPQEGWDWLEKYQ